MAVVDRQQRIGNRYDGVRRNQCSLAQCYRNQLGVPGALPAVELGRRDPEVRVTPSLHQQLNAQGTRDLVGVTDGETLREAAEQGVFDYSVDPK